MFKPFMLLLHVTVITPGTGIDTVIDRIYTPSEDACKQTQVQLLQVMNWVKYKRDENDEVIFAYSIAKVTCIPMRSFPMREPGRP